MWCLIVPGARKSVGADLGVREPGADEPQDLALARGEADRAGGAAAARRRRRGERVDRARAARARAGPWRSRRARRRRGRCASARRPSARSAARCARRRRSGARSRAAGRAPTSTSATSNGPLASASSRLRDRAALDPRDARQQPAQAVAQHLMIFDHQDPQPARGGDARISGRVFEPSATSIDPPQLTDGSFLTRSMRAAPSDKSRRPLNGYDERRRRRAHRSRSPGARAAGSGGARPR